MVDTEAEKAEMERVLSMVEAAENRKDIDGILEHVTQDGLLLMAGAPLIQGPDAWRASYQRFFGGGFISTSLTCLGREVAASGDMAWDYGTFVSTFEGPNGRTTSEGSFLQVWKKVDGKWKGAAVSIG